eukprot:1158734-Pelagomonas_calceolata.AAC.1
MPRALPHPAWPCNVCNAHNGSLMHGVFRQTGLFVDLVAGSVHTTTAHCIYKSVTGNQGCSVRRSVMKNAMKCVENASSSNCLIACLVVEGGGRDRGQQSPYRHAPAFHPLTFQL